MQVETITREQYKDKRTRDYAGTVTKTDPAIVATWKEFYPDWLGKHWHLEPGPKLAPVNVRG